MKEDKQEVTGSESEEDKKLLKEILANIQIDIEADYENRKEMLDDLKFCTLDQWPAELRASRENDPNGARPCLTIDKINQYITQVVNDMRQNRPSIKTRPVDDRADVKTAKVFQGLVRHIEDKSSASIAYENAGEWTTRVGRGFFRIVNEYVDGSFDQEPRIRPIQDAFSTYLGPHIMPDGSDAKRGTIFEELSEDDFKRQFPKAKYSKESFDGLGNAGDIWRKDKTITIAEHFYVDYEEKELLFLSSGESVLSDDFDGAETEILKRRTIQQEKVKWCKLTGAEILEKRDWLGKYIPIIEVIGKQSFVEGKQYVWGLVRPAKDNLRMYNYWASSITEKIGLSPKAPFIGATGQFNGKEEQWRAANKENRAYLEYNPIDVNGNALPRPERVQPSAMEGAMVQMMGMIENDVRASLGMYKASVGDSSSQQSGRALLALQRESDTGTLHFSDNLAYSIAHAGRILVDLIPKLYDTRRIIRILGEDGESKSAIIDPQQQQSLRQIETNNGIKEIYNLGAGTYDVTVTVGPSYNTKRMEAAQVFTDLARSATDPGSAAVMNYLAIKNSDVTSSDEATVMLKALLPPQVQSVEDGQAPIPPEAMQQIQQMQQQGQMLQQEIQKMQQENQMLKIGAQEGQMKIQVGAQESQMKIQAKQQESMANLELDQQVQSAKMQLEREIAMNKLQLEREIASAQLELERMKIQAYAENEANKTMHKANIDNMANYGKDSEGTNHEEGLSSMMQMHQEIMAEIQQAIEEASKKKSITMKSPSG